jgi:hypothetical protein
MEKNQDKIVNLFCPHSLHTMQVQELEQFVKKASELLEKRKSPEFSEKEEQLIQRIQTGGPDERAWSAYGSLAEKLETGKMDETEHRRFTQLNQEVEKWSLERLKLVKELADLWGTSIDVVFDKLKLRPK